MVDLVVTDIPQADYDWLCKEAAGFGMTAADYFSILVKAYAKELYDAKAGKSSNPS